MKIKVWGVGWMGTHRRIVATTSKKRAAELIGTSYYHFNEYASQTGNKEEVELAMSKPETVFEHRDFSGQPWKEINADTPSK